ncbi:Apoptosis-inducing factor 3 [Liparis tanakae]|uniref:Apoptosis-inducing factor 3 n=1 Tax=Liparis tanakae TaxID=230148 RepID=A0A4Z2FCY6_9TELE|nr:Apoptosis-inducing factor 3 [Liparis tanakae]
MSSVTSGPASLVCAETLRQNAYRGRIVMVTRDTLPPYDKPKLSKALDVDGVSILLRTRDFYQQLEVEVWTQKEVVSVDPADKAVLLSDGSSQRYDQLLIATGCRARPLDCPGRDLKGVELLQRYEDAKEIHHAGLGRNAVVVGSSFIGMEVASYLSDKAASVAVVGTSGFPYQRSLGPEIGGMSMRVKRVVLKSGRVLEADVVIAGIGVIPNSDFLAGSGLEVDLRKAVVVDKVITR